MIAFASDPTPLERACLVSPTAAALVAAAPELAPLFAALGGLQAVLPLLERGLVVALAGETTFPGRSVRTARHPDR